MRTFQKTAALIVGVTACGSAPSIAPAPAVAPPEVTIAQVRSVQALVGETVIVTGRCLAPSASVRAVGTRPTASKLWQFEDNGVAVWVSGPKPRECSDGPSESTSITARVVQDSLPLLSAPRTLRQYLVVR